MQFEVLNNLTFLRVFKIDNTDSKELSALSSALTKFGQRQTSSGTLNFRSAEGLWSIKTDAKYQRYPNKNLPEQTIITNNPESQIKYMP